MRGKLILILLMSGLVFTSVALAATSAPVGNGRYTGRDNSRSFLKSSRSVTLIVTKNKREFAYGRLNFWLNGQLGLGSCAGPAYVSLIPSSQRQISPAGKFDLHGHFSFKVATPYGPQAYQVVARIEGAFGNRGRKVAGTLTETASHKGFSCHSGTVRFSAGLVK